MKPKEIKASVDFLLGQAKKWSDEKGQHQERIRVVDKNIGTISDELRRIRNECKHVYPKGNGRVMGKGFCEVCGESDY